MRERTNDCSISQPAPTFTKASAKAWSSCEPIPTGYRTGARRFADRPFKLGAAEVRLAGYPIRAALRAHPDQIRHLAQQRGNILRVDRNLLLIAHRIARGFSFF